MYLVLRLCCTMMDIVNTRYTPRPHWLICPHQVELYSKDKKGKKNKKKNKLSVFSLSKLLLFLSQSVIQLAEKKKLI